MLFNIYVASGEISAKDGAYKNLSKDLRWIKPGLWDTHSSLPTHPPGRIFHRSLREMKESSVGNWKEKQPFSLDWLGAKETFQLILFYQTGSSVLIFVTQICRKNSSFKANNIQLIYIIDTKEKLNQNQIKVSVCHVVK